MLLLTLLPHADRATVLRWGWIGVQLVEAAWCPLGKLSR
ncbi:MAG: hypothetical protein ACJAVR_001613 [Paracoccaceae bacterium]|jgi:hypothetical protein